MTTKAQFHLIGWRNPKMQLPAPLCEIGDTGVWLFDDGSRLLHTTKGLVELPRVVAIRWVTEDAPRGCYLDIEDAAEVLRINKDHYGKIEFLEIAK